MKTIDPADVELPPTQPIDITAWMQQSMRSHGRPAAGHE
jgi:hypothetical protein